MHQQPSTSRDRDIVEGLHGFLALTDRHAAAINQLEAAYRDEHPIAILIGEGKLESNHVIGGFLARLAGDATVVRLNEPHRDALEGMQEINRALGFEPKDLSLSDLRNILTMFLEFQRKHRKRTVLCVEQADEQALWLLDNLGRLVESEESDHYGLMIVMSGGPRLDDVLRESSLKMMRGKAGRPIRLEPFSLVETREFVRQRTESTGLGDVSGSFEFEAVDRLHKLSGGIPDTLGKLCQQSLTLANPTKNGPVTAKLVVKAARHLRLASSLEMAVSVVDQPDPTVKCRPRECLVARCGDQEIQQMVLRRGRFLVGRARFADVCLPSASVSRRHALLIKSVDSLQVLDLGSTNGTYVYGTRISEHTLEVGSVLTLGDCEIEYKIG